MLFITLPSVRTVHEMSCATSGEQVKEIKPKIYYLYTCYWKKLRICPAFLDYVYTSFIYMKQSLLPFSKVTHLLKDPKFPTALHLCIKAFICIYVARP